MDNALRLLGLFCEQRSIRIAEAGQAIGVARSTALRLMQMLAYHGYAIQDSESRAYLVGPELIRMAVAVVRDLDIRSIAKPVMLEMHDALGETVHLSIRQGPEILFIDSVESRKSLRVGTRTGQKMPGHATAAGKVLLADLDQEHLRPCTRSPALRPEPPGRLPAAATWKLSWRRYGNRATPSTSAKAKTR
ncbi:MAG TPA: IclR family transcriptional regulator [Trebonia sp.]|nr:IclR family transcriptional regulator [Trebonia sp.]